ncbi:hypothetical protein CDD81_6714 [Ophiocordyceps australis]|uniref:Uncharacterized protein n=1 Tax=Ophiocordyceps australis TaxID=1399860 RepID=A0A2C5Y4W8_9HYPO|nr:hypothetical protein CDD81_6714 [Ophiocordyceps australis]
MSYTADASERRIGQTYISLNDQDVEIALYAHLRYGTRLPAWVSSRYFFQPHRLAGQERASTDVYALNTRGFGLNANCAPCRLHPLLSENDSLSLNTIRRAGCPDAIIKANESREGTCRLPLMTNLFAGLDKKCGTAFMMGWDARPDEPAQQLGAAAINHGAVCCRPVLETAMFNVTIDSLGYIKSANRTTALEYRIGSTADDEANMHTVLRFFINYALPHAPVYNDFYLSCPSELFALLLGGRDFLTSRHPLPDAMTLIPLIEDFYYQYFALFLWRQQDIFQQDRAGNAIQGSRLEPERRIFMDRYALGIVFTILLIDIVVAIVFYSSISAIRILPFMPSSIGSLMAYIAPSRLVARWRWRSIDENTAIRFGRYYHDVGLDGRRHIGLEMDQYVMPVDVSCLEKRGTRWKSWLTRLSWPSWRMNRAQRQQREESSGQAGSRPTSLNAV